MGTDSRTRTDPRRGWIAAPPVLLILLDAFMTLFFQPPEFWDVSYQFGVENNPISQALMHVHPIWFAVFILAWIGFVVVLVFRLRAPWNRALALAVVIGHAWGFSSWLYDRSRLTYWPRIAFFLSIGILTIFLWEKANPPVDAPPVDLPRTS